MLPTKYKNLNNPQNTPTLNAKSLFFMEWNLVVRSHYFKEPIHQFKNMD
jgi:hypothetical protein